MEVVDGTSIGKEESEAMKAVEAEEMQIYEDIRHIKIQEIQKRKGVQPCGNMSKLIDITEAHSITDDERHSLYKSLGITTKHKQIFSITGITNNTAISTLGREIAIAGRFLDELPDIDWKKTRFFFIFGNRSHRAVCLGEWVFSCIPMFRLPGTVNFYLSLDGTTPISQILKFDFLSTPTNQELFSTFVGFRQQLCLAHLLYSKTKRLTDLSRLSNSSEAKIMHNLVLSYCERNTTTFIRSIQNPFGLGESLYLEFLLEMMLTEWIYEKRLEKRCTTETLNFQGLGVIHMLAILGYRLLIRLYFELGKGKLSLDFADVTGWTALHWAAFFNRNQTTQLLVDMGANPTLVTGRTIEFPNGLTVAEVASKNGHLKLASHLAIITEEYLSRSLATVDASSSQVQLDTKNGTEKGGVYASGKQRFRGVSVSCQALKIQAAFRGFKARKHYAGRQLYPRIGFTELVGVTDGVGTHN